MKMTPSEDSMKTTNNRKPHKHAFQKSNTDSDLFLEKYRTPKWSIIMQENERIQAKFQQSMLGTSTSERLHRKYSARIARSYELPRRSKSMRSMPNGRGNEPVPFSKGSNEVSSLLQEDVIPASVSVRRKGCIKDHVDRISQRRNNKDTTSESSSTPQTLVSVNGTSSVETSTPSSQKECNDYKRPILPTMMYRHEHRPLYRVGVQYYCTQENTLHVKIQQTGTLPDLLKRKKNTKLVCDVRISGSKSKRFTLAKSSKDNTFTSHEFLFKSKYIEGLDVRRIQVTLMTERVFFKRNILSVWNLDLPKSNYQLHSEWYSYQA